MPRSSPLDIEIDLPEDLTGQYGPVYVRVQQLKDHDEQHPGTGIDNPAGMARRVRAEAIRGSVQAQVLWGHLLLSGHGVHRDPEAAFRWFRIAAGTGDPDALNMLGRCFELGWGVETNAARAAQYYQAAANQGHAWAQFNLGSLMIHGQGVAQDYRGALTLFVKSARQGNEKAMNMLGRYREEGWACRPKRSSAFRWYRRAAERGCFRGQFHYSRFLCADQNIEAAAHWLRASLAGAPSDFRREIVDALSNHPIDAIRQAALDHSDQAATGTV